MRQIPPVVLYRYIFLRYFLTVLILRRYSFLLCWLNFQTNKTPPTQEKPLSPESQRHGRKHIDIHSENECPGNNKPFNLFDIKGENERLGSNAGRMILNPKGRILEIRWFDPMGRMTVGGGTGTFKDAYFQGRPIYQDLKLQYFRARFRDVPSGNFLTHDPIPFDQFAGARSQYEFALSNAVNFEDPTGLKPVHDNRKIRKLPVGIVFGGFNPAPSVLTAFGRITGASRIYNDMPIPNKEFIESNIVGDVPKANNYIKQVSKSNKKEKIEPVLFVVGISEGGGAAVILAAKHKIRFLGTIDAVRFSLPMLGVSSNVQRHVNFYQRNRRASKWIIGAPIRGAKSVLNMNLSDHKIYPPFTKEKDGEQIHHFNIDDYDLVHKRIKNEILRILTTEFKWNYFK